MSEKALKEDSNERFRSPICVVVGHVDHGKSSILDKIRGSCIVDNEPGRITQAIGASIIPLDTIKKVCGPLLKRINIQFTIPGLLFIDTPGHAAFRSLRKRGGNLADFAILVIDINEGFMPQTEESIQILKTYKTPFVVAANKIDLIQGWQSFPEKPLLEDIQSQSEFVKRELDEKIYKIVESLYNLGFEAERFDRVSDYTKQVAIVPVSAKTGEGIPELLMVLIGLTQKYLAQTLKVKAEGPAKGTILEVKEEPGIGKTIDVIIYDGVLRKGDTIIIGGLEKPIITKVRALFEPMPLAEMRDKKTRFKNVDFVVAANGVKILAPDLEGVFSGMPIRVLSKNDDVEKIKAEVQAEVDEVIIETEEQGVIVKADSLGSLEGITFLLKQENIPIRKASLGPITKKDVIEAEANEDDFKVIIGFNTKPTSETLEYMKMNKSKVKVITSDVIYKIIDEYKKFVSEREKEKIDKELSNLIRPCRIRIMPQYIFRQSNPAVVGVDVEAGTLRVGMPLMNSDGKQITSVKSIQSENKNLSEATKKQVAVALEKVTVGRQIKGNDILYSAIPENDFRKLKSLKKYLSNEEIEVMKEIAAIMRKNNPVWGL